MKKTLSLLLVLAMVLTSFTAVFAADETEKTPGEILEQIGVLKGNTEGGLMLDKEVSRRDMVVLLSRLLGQEDEAKNFSGDTTFKDVKDTTDPDYDSYYVSYIAWAQANKLTNGVDESGEVFSPKRSQTEQEVLAYLLRALGYGFDEVKWEDVVAKAAELKLIDDAKADYSKAATREVLAKLSLQALKTKVKDSDKTLAEKLEITLPEAAKLEVKEVKADNLKEIKVVFNKSVDEESAVDENNYETDAGNIADINYSADDHTATILLDEAMKNKEEYELTIDGVKDAKTVLDVTKDFTVADNAIPEVVDVVGLGTKAVKVVMSEPVDGAKATNFKLDGKSAYGSVEVAAGRDIILKTYSDVSVGDHELTVSGLKDFAGFKLVESKHSFTVVEDKDAPTVTETRATLEKVVVTFSEDIDTVSKNNVYWKNGSTKNYADSAKRLAGNKFEFTFEGNKGLPVYETTLYIEGVKDYSGNKMATTEVVVKASIDETRPTVRKVEVKSSGKVIVVTFSKSVNTSSSKDEKGSALNRDNYKITDSDDNKQTISDITNPKKDNKTIEIELGTALKSSKDYTIKISGIKDNNKYPNYMVDYSETLSATEYNAPKLARVSVKQEDEKDERTFKVSLYFDKAMDLATLSDPANYLIATKKAGASDDTATNKLLSKFDDYDVDIKDSDGKIVLLTIVTDKDDDLAVAGVAGLGIKGSNGKEISNYGRIVPDTEGEEFVLKTAKATDRDEVELVFNLEVGEAPTSAFSVTGVGIEDVDVDGDTVTIKLSSDLDADVTNKLSITKSKVLAYDGTELIATTGQDLTDLELKDEVSPKIKAADILKEDVVGTTIKITVTFDEKLGTYASNWDDDLSVKAINGGKDITFTGEPVLDSGNPTNKLKLTVDLTQENLKNIDKTAFEVSTEDARYIEDAHQNVAADSSARTGIFEGIQDRVKNGGNEAAAEAAVKALEVAAEKDLTAKENLEAAEKAVTDAKVAVDKVSDTTVKAGLNARIVVAENKVKEARTKFDDELAVAAARTTVEKATYAKAPNTVINEDLAKTYVDDIIKGLDLKGVTYEINKVGFTAPTVGGDGSYIFNVKLSKGVATVTTNNITLEITAQ
ncbi:Ig-like domain-containing protein [Sporanaerobacter sp. PP17-6a]|uniref:Ig-like domain-containing protein n=1 Tax=Sporanaerobacter sp. PP17-6a TaxID=1891289 RepID=UPI0008A00B4C|nr:Ig-like domain-containing protein [Sporanaerobacter sp. PP17-6a]SCL87036.1 Outer cell wall protein precursor [Sporanaerobacter sp. PP17-6a]